MEQIARTEDAESMHDSSSSINIQMNQRNENLADTITEGENTVDIESDKFKELIQKWAKNLEKYERFRLDEREYETRVNMTIKRDTMKNMNFIVGQHLEQTSHDTGISLWDLNVTYYSAAVTVLQQEGLLKEIKNANRNVKPGWQIQLELLSTATGICGFDPKL